MATLAPGVLRNLLEGMYSGTQKKPPAAAEAGGPRESGRSAMLQVTDIVPADLDEKDLFPKRGFYIKVSDSSHSIYVTLPLEQHDLVLSNKLQLGQFIHLDRLEPASPVPVIVGAKPLPGRHPLVGTPEPIVRIKGSGRLASASASPAHRRGSWDRNPISSVKTMALDFREKTPMNDRSQIGGTASSMLLSPPASGRRVVKEGISTRSSVSGTLISKMADEREASAVAVRKSCSITKFSRSRSVVERDPKIPKTPFPASKLTNSTPMDKSRSSSKDSSSCASDERGCSTTFENSHYQSGESAAGKHTSGGERMPLPAKLITIGKEALEHREAAQKVALQALRDVSATETIVRVLKMFSQLSSRAKPEAPAACFDQFLSFHQEILQAAVDLEAIQVATSITAASDTETDDSSILQERDRNLMNQTGRLATTATKRRAVSVMLESLNENKVNLGKHPRSEVNHKVASEKAGKDEVKTPTSSTLGRSISMAKQLRAEAGKWFMEFLEEALETGLQKKTKGSKSDGGLKSVCCPQSLILRVINWMELEQSESNKKPLHPRATQIARKLRIKAKNPS